MLIDITSNLIRINQSRRVLIPASHPLPAGTYGKFRTGVACLGTYATTTSAVPAHPSLSIFQTHVAFLGTVQKL